MSETRQNQPFYWFDTTTGHLFLSPDDLPEKKGRLYLVVNRELLFFNSFTLQTGKRVKDSHILNVQKHFVPFQGDYLNFIYYGERAELKRYFSWVGGLTVDVQSYFYDEIPESLLFKGDPNAVKHYSFFVFERVTGFEVIYFNGDDFYSMFVRRDTEISQTLLVMARKFSIKDRLSILSDVDIPLLNQLPDYLDVETTRVADSERYFFLPDVYPVRKKYSNISQSKQLKSIKSIMQQWNRNLGFIAALLFLVLLVNGLGFLKLKSDNRKFQTAFARVDRLDNRAERLRFKLNKLKRKIAEYPDHMRYLKAVTDAMDEDSTLTGYSREEGIILLEGFSRDSLGLLTRLRKSKQFKDVRFRTTVTKNVYSQREKFEIQLVYGDEGGK